MNCVICKTGQISAGTAIVTLQQGETTVACAYRGLTPEFQHRNKGGGTH
jgi:hypothetical protein